MDFINEFRGFRLALDSGLNHREFVAAEAGRDIGRLEATAQPVRHAHQKLVADGMTERIVDALELVDVDIEHGELLARPHRLHRLFEPFAEQHPVRQVGQGVVMRQMRDLLVGAGALGNVLDRGDPAARLQRPVDDLDRAAARRFGELTRGLAERDLVDDGIAEVVDVAVKRSGLLPVTDQPLHGAARLDHLRRQPEHLDIGLVADDDPRRCVIENKPLRDVVDGDCKLAPLRGQPLLGQPMAQQQETDHDRENGDKRGQDIFAQAPCRHRNAGRTHRRKQHATKRGLPDDPGAMRRDWQDLPAIDGRCRWSP